MKNTELTQKIQLHKSNMDNSIHKVAKTSSAANFLFDRLGLAPWVKVQAISVIITKMYPEIENRILYRDGNKSEAVGITFYNDIFWFSGNCLALDLKREYLVSFRTFAIPEKIYNKLPRTKKELGRNRGDGNYMFNIAVITPVRENA